MAIGKDGGRGVPLRSTLSGRLSAKRVLLNDELFTDTREVFSEEKTAPTADCYFSDC